MNTTRPPVVLLQIHSNCILLSGPQAEKRACLYEAGKTVLRYEERPGSAALPPFSREIIFGPQPHQDQLPESSHTSEGSQETADSGHYSNEEMSSEEMSSSSSGSGSSRAEPPSSGPADGSAVVVVVVEFTPSFRMENNKIEICALPHRPLDVGGQAGMVSLPSMFPPQLASS